MAQLLVRNLDDALIARLRARAARNGRSVEAEHREILREALAARDGEDFWELARRLRAETAGRIAIPSEVLLREDRDAR